MSTLFWLGVGLLVGWNIPRPLWVKKAQTYVVDKIKSIFNKE